jgi:hypothetical protein
MIPNVVVSSLLGSRPKIHKLQKQRRQPQQSINTSESHAKEIEDPVTQLYNVKEELDKLEETQNKIPFRWTNCDSNRPHNLEKGGMRLRLLSIERVKKQEESQRQESIQVDQSRVSLAT